MRFIFIEGMLGSTPTRHPLQMLGPVLGGSGPQESSSHTPPRSRRPLPGAIWPGWRFRGRPRPLQSRGSGSGSSAGDPGVRAPERAPRSPPRGGPGGREPSWAAGPSRGRTAAPRARASPTPGGDPPPAPAACARVSVCLSSRSTSVGISSQEVRE